MRAAGRKGSSSANPGRHPLVTLTPHGGGVFSRTFRIREEGGDAKEIDLSQDIRGPTSGAGQLKARVREGVLGLEPQPSASPPAASAQSRAQKQTQFSSTYTLVIDPAARVSVRAGLGSGRQSLPLHAQSAGPARAQSRAPNYPGDGGGGWGARSGG